MSRDDKTSDVRSDGRSAAALLAGVGSFWVRFIAALCCTCTSRVPRDPAECYILHSLKSTCCCRLKIQPLALPHINCAHTPLSVRTRVSEKAGLASLQMQRGGARERNGAPRFDLLLCVCVLLCVDNCRVRVKQCDDVYHVRHALLHAHASDS